MLSRLFLVAGLAGASVCSYGGCQTHNYTQRGAALGGVTGGGLGAIIGEAAADRPLVGAVVGSAVGAMTGASVGEALDEIDGRSQQRVDQALYARQSQGTSLPEIVAMSRSGLSEDVITRHVRTYGFYQRLSAQDLINLRDQGVSDGVISALQQAAAAHPPAVAQTAAIAPAPPVIVEEHIHAPVFAGPPHWRYRRRVPPYCPPQRSVHWGISFGH